MDSDCKDREVDRRIRLDMSIKHSIRIMKNIAFEKAFISQKEYIWEMKIDLLFSTEPVYLYFYNHSKANNIQLYS